MILTVDQCVGRRTDKGNPTRKRVSEVEAATESALADASGYHLQDCSWHLKNDNRGAKGG